jgi:hypothetical protein
VLPVVTPVVEPVVTAPVASVLALPVPTGAVFGAHKVSKLSPFPLVRIRGYLTPGGVRVTLLSVRSPHGARIVVRCFGRTCPVTRWAHTTVVTRIVRMQRVLAAGTRLVVSVTRPGYIGKHTVLVIRDGRAPLRRDRCLNPGSSRPVACPS